MDDSACGECGRPAVMGARFCGSCGAVLASAEVTAASTAGTTTAATTSGAAPGPRREAPEGREGGHVGRGRQRRIAWAGLAVTVAVLAFVAWPSSSELGPDDRSGRDTVASLPAELVVRWDVPGPGIGGPVDAGRSPVRVGEGSIAVADVVVDPDGEPTAVRPPGAVVAGVWAAAGRDGLVVGDAATGRVTAIRSWPATLTVTPVGPVLAWVGGAGADVPGDPVVAIAEGGAVRLGGNDLDVRWRADVVPVVDDVDVATGGGVLVPARSPGGSTADTVLDLSDGRVAVRTTGDLGLLGIGHGLVFTADGDDSVAAWPVPDAPSTLVLPGGAGPRWEVSLAPGRPVGVDVLEGGRVALHAVDIVVGEARLVDVRDGTVLAIVAGFPNRDLDGGRTAEAFDDGVVGIVGDELRRFGWDSRRLATVSLGREGWFVARGDRLLHLVAWRTGESRLVTADGTEVPAAVPPPRSDGPDRVVGAMGSAARIAGPGGSQWVDVRTGALDTVGPSLTPSPPADEPQRGLDAPAAAVAVAGPVDGAEVVVEPGSVTLLTRADRAEVWRTTLPARPALARRTPDAHPGVVITSRHVVLPLADGSVVALDRDRGDVAWTARVGVPSAVVGAGEEVIVATVDGAVVRLGPDGTRRQVAALDGVVDELAVVGDVLLALLPERLVGIGAPGGPIPDDDRVELSAPRGPRPSAPGAAARWHPARVPLSMSPGG